MSLIEPEIPGPLPAWREERAVDRLHRLQAELKAAADEEVQALEAALDHVREIAESIVAEHDAFPPGVREICRAMAETLQAQQSSIVRLMRPSLPGLTRR